MAGKGKIENLKPFGKGFDPRRNLRGRPDKLLLHSKESGYSPSQAAEMIQSIWSLDHKDIEKMAKLKQAGINGFQRWVAAMLWRGILRGDAYIFETLMNRLFGSPVQRIEEDSKIEVTWVEPDEKAKENSE